MQNNDQQLTYFVSVDDDFECDLDTDSIMRNKPPNFQGMNRPQRQSLSCSCLLNIDQFINNQGDYCADTVSQEIPYNSSTRDIPAIGMIKKFDTIDDEDAVEVPRPRSIAPPEPKPSTESKKIIFDSPKKAKGKNSIKKRLRILGRPFARLGEGMLHAMEHIMEAVPDLIEEFTNN